MPIQNTDTMMSFDSHGLPKQALDATDTVKIEDEDDVKKERCRLINAERRATHVGASSAQQPLRLLHH
jgi:hypothetical protein